MPEETPGLTNPEAGLPYPDEVLFAPPQRSVVPRPVFRHKRIRSLYARGVRLTRLWSVDRVIVGLFCIFAFSLVGVGVADAFFCPEGTAARFWEGCLWETVGFGIGGGVFGFAFFLLTMRAFDRWLPQRPDPTSGSDTPADSVTQPLEDK